MTTEQMPNPTGTERALSILVHGSSKTGKSWFGDTSPKPILVLDAEGGSRFTPSRKITWDPLMYAPPEYDGTWDTCIVYVRDYATVLRAYQWLAVGQHSFKSVVLDSISEIQQRCKDAIGGGMALTDQRQWGDLDTQVSVLARQFRDLTIHPTNPLTAVVIIAMTRMYDGKWKPYTQGQISIKLPFYFDIVGYMDIEQAQDGNMYRRMIVVPMINIEAGERVGGRVGPVIYNPNMSEMIDQIFGVEH